MKLYFSPGACSLASHIALAELNSVYETEVVDLKSKTCLTGDFTKINAKGSVPVLKMDNGEYLTEGVAIMTYIADSKPEANLLPKHGTIDRIRATEWMNYIATEIHKGFSPLWSADRMFSVITNNAVVDTNVVTNYKNYIVNTLGTKFDYINAKLGSNDFFMGKNFTVVDAYMFTCLSWAKHMDIDMSKWSNLSAFMDRVYKRPAVQSAMKLEGILK